MKKLIVPLLAGPRPRSRWPRGWRRRSRKKDHRAGDQCPRPTFWTIAGRGLEKGAEGTPGIQYRVDRHQRRGPAAGQRRELGRLEWCAASPAISISVDDAAQRKPKNSTRLRPNTVLITTDSGRAAEQASCLYRHRQRRSRGGRAGEEIKKALPDGGKIALFVGHDGCRQRPRAGAGHQGSDRRQPRSSWSTCSPTRWTPPKAKANMENVLVKYPDIALLSGLWSYEDTADL